jgi:hypothetical protein
MSYAVVPQRSSMMWFDLSGAPSCEVDLDCSGDNVCCGTPDGIVSCIDWDSCESKVDSQCKAEPYKSTAACEAWKKNPEGWYEEWEGPCTSDAECWPTLSCCGERGGKRYCIPKSECSTKQSASADQEIPTWAYVAGGGAVVLLIVAALA